ncbi:MAG: hypothetical protein KatS3mg027_1217 [Bacteroidia bacterium]|nr:MAG: hypothetical protein KatS3mg027_1217 [Bacteroidia bacterium]
MQVKKYFFIVFVFFLSSFLHSQVKINEYSCANLSSFQDNFGNYEDWIELYNPTASPINLSGYYLSDVVTKPTKWMFGAGVTIPANGFFKNLGIRVATSIQVLICIRTLNLHKQNQRLLYCVIRH